MNRFRNLDYLIFFLVVGLCCFGILMVFSASYYTYQFKTDSTGVSLVIKHAINVIAGLGIMTVVMMFFDYHWLAKLRIFHGRVGLLPFLAVLLSLGLLVVVFFIGQNLNGADRWIRIFGISVQPSEIARISMVLFVADQLSYFYDEICQRRNFRLCMDYAWPTFLVAGLLCVLILAGNALSMTAITGITFLILLWVANFNTRLVGFISVGVFAMGAAVIRFSEFRWNRMMIFRDPWQDPQGAGYQLIQSLYALGNGGLFGVGIGNSRQKYQYLTYGDSDYILSIISEEVGFVGVVILILAYLFLIYRGLLVARRAPDRLGMLLATGITSILAIQLIINILVVTSVMPPTGVPLPFISSGGSSLLIFLASMGLLLNISRFRTQV